MLRDGAPEVLFPINCYPCAFCREFRKKCQLYVKGDSLKSHDVQRPREPRGHLRCLKLILKKTSFLTESQTGHGKEVFKNNNDNDSDNNNYIMKNMSKREGNLRSFYCLYLYIESAWQNKF